MSNSDGPKFELIAEELMAAIKRGDYGPGDRLPGENELARDYGVAAMTARRALGVLKRLGVAESRRGGGTYVQAFKPIRRRGIARLAREQWGAGKSIWAADENRSLAVDQVSVTEEEAPPPVAAVLDINVGGMACVRTRRYLVDGRPVMLATSYLPSDLVTGTAITRTDTGPGGVYARLAELGHSPSHFREELRVESPTSHEAQALGIPQDRPVVKLSRTAFSADGRAVEVNAMTLDSAAYVLEYEFDA
ncbi:GntR family transcriptional regulator [Kitasatospora sp. NPDC085895]|uniref:GntR family transcriptional regulator n=1 Tax=Kitasatospora sp. NPDC085895 TaxID=3155057 RepID=UPI00344FFB20